VKERLVTYSRPAETLSRSTKDH